jgi:hypothetical protein
MQINPKIPKFGDPVGTCKKLAILLPVMWASHCAPWSSCSIEGCNKGNMKMKLNILNVLLYTGLSDDTEIVILHFELR